MQQFAVMFSLLQNTILMLHVPGLLDATVIGDTLTITGLTNFPQANGRTFTRVSLSANDGEVDYNSGTAFWEFIFVAGENTDAAAETGFVIVNFEPEPEQQLTPVAATLTLINN